MDLKCVPKVSQRVNGGAATEGQGGGAALTFRGVLLRSSPRVKSGENVIRITLFLKNTTLVWTVGH